MKINEQNRLFILSRAVLRGTSRTFLKLAMVRLARPSIHAIVCVWWDHMHCLECPQAATAATAQQDHCAGSSISEGHTVNAELSTAATDIPISMW